MSDSEGSTEGTWAADEIPGMFYFAWLNSGNVPFSDACCVVDEDIFAFTLEHLEGDFASLTISVRNPRVGLLGPTRPLWCWLSRRVDDANVVPLFHGRLVGIPSDIDREVVTLEFLARPADFVAQKAQLAEELKVAPFWDPVFVDETRVDDPDAVLSARTSLWHIGRTDKTVTISDIIYGEDGLIEVTEDDVLNDSIRITYGDPVNIVNVSASVQWDQYVIGTVDLSELLKNRFRDLGSKIGRITSYTGQGLENTWPRFNDPIGGGWRVGESEPRLINRKISSSKVFKAPLDPTKATPDIEIEDWWETSPQGYNYWYGKAYEAWLRTAMADTNREAHFYLWEFAPVFKVNYEASRARREVLTFSVNVDIQPLTSEDDPKSLDISISSNSLSEPIDFDGERPIRDLTRNQYFGTDRGAQSLEYLLALARAHGLAAARCVEISLELPFALVAEISCRHNLHMTLPQLPGGEAIGKVVGYAMALSNGDLRCSVTAACAIGRGNEVEASTGEGDYVEDDYVVNYQNYVGGEIGSVPDLTYEEFLVVPSDDGLNFSNLRPEDILNATSAFAYFTFDDSSNATNGSTITIGGRVYTFVNALSAPDQVKIGSDYLETSFNLVDALNGVESRAGITYSNGTTANVSVEATAQDGIVLVIARVAGESGNNIAVSGATAGTWDVATLRGGDDGLELAGGQSEQEDVLEEVHGSAEEAIDDLNDHFTDIQLSLKPVEGGPFETPISIVVSGLMVPKMIDLE